MPSLLYGSNRRALSLGILCFQGFGIRIFEGVMQGAIVLWLVVLVLLNLRSIFKVPLTYWIKGGALCVLYLAFCSLKSVQPAYFLLVAWVSAMVVLTNYYNGMHSFLEDMSKLTNFCMYYSLIHVPIVLLFSNYLVETSFGMHPRTFCYLFYFNNGEGVWGLPRIQGFCWEPSCWNLLLNLNLIFVLWMKKSRRTMILAILAIVSVMSTTGLVTMVVVIGLYYVTSIQRKTIFNTLITGSLVLALIAPFVYEELNHKLETGSGMSRVGDFAIAVAVMQRNPLLGDDMQNITQINYAMSAREEAWDVSGDHQGYMDQGFTNAFASLFVEWGLPLSLMLFALMYFTPLFPDKKLRFLYITVLLCVLMGTPISRTGFFYMHAFSTILFFKRETRKKSKAYYEKFNTIRVQRY